MKWNERKLNFPHQPNTLGQKQKYFFSWNSKILQFTKNYLISVKNHICCMVNPSHMRKSCFFFPNDLSKISNDNPFSSAPFFAFSHVPRLACQGALVIIAATDIDDEVPRASEVIYAALVYLCHHFIYPLDFLPYHR